MQTNIVVHFSCLHLCCKFLPCHLSVLITLTVVTIVMRSPVFFFLISLIQILLLAVRLLQHLNSLPLLYAFRYAYHLSK